MERSYERASLALPSVHSYDYEPQSRAARSITHNSLSLAIPLRTACQMPGKRSQGIIVLLLLGTLTLIAYGSLYPFELLPRVHTLTLGETLLEVSWARSSRGDRIANILLY